MLKNIFLHMFVLFAVTFPVVCFGELPDHPKVVVLQIDNKSDVLAQGVLELVNRERAKEGVAPLHLASDLMEGSAIRAQEIIKVFSHTRPDGLPYHSLFKDGMYRVGENIAAGSSTPEAVVEQWMNSPGHRTNILNSDYDELGVGHAYDANTTFGHYWVQMFRRPISKSVMSRGRSHSSDKPSLGRGHSMKASVADSKTNSKSISGSIYDEKNRSIAAFAEEVLQLVNVERAKVGAAPLRLNNELQNAAVIRAEEITRHFAHERPDGSSCFTLLRNRNRTLGENIAAGNATPEEVVDQWMHSPGHRANILNKAFRELGVGYCCKEGTEYTHYWIQMFRG